MPSEYPTGIDNFIAPTASTFLGSETAELKHATQHANLNDAVNKIESELGTNPSGASYSTVAARIAAIESSVISSNGTVTGAVLTDRNLTLQTSGSNRWTLTATATAESSPSMVGSDFELRAFTDGGAYRTGTGIISGSTLGAVIRVTRSTGAVALGGTLTVAGATSVSNTLTVSGSNATTLGGSLTVTGAAQFNGTLTVASGQTTTLGTRVDAGSVTYATVPVGTISAYGGTTAPNGWVLCDGASYSTTGTYAALYSVLGTRYGSGTGTFNVPNLVAKFPQGPATVASNAATGLGTSGGNATTTLTTTELPAHTHSVSTSHTHPANTTGSGGGHNHTVGFTLNDATAFPSPSDEQYARAGSNTLNTRFNAPLWGGTVADHTHTTPALAYTGTVTSDSIGTGSSFSNLPPYVVVNYIIKF